jgi:hypothetical protein
MIQDPIIKEVRKVRHEIEAECANDGGRYFQHLQEIQKKYKKLIRRHPKQRVQVKEPRQSISAPV